MKPDQLATESDAYVVFRYRAVKRRSREELFFSIAGRDVWLPKSQIKLLPGNLVRVSLKAARARKLGDNDGA